MCQGRRLLGQSAEACKMKEWRGEGALSPCSVQQQTWGEWFREEERMLFCVMGLNGRKKPRVLNVYWCSRRRGGFVEEECFGRLFGATSLA